MTEKKFDAAQRQLVRRRRVPSSGRTGTSILQQAWSSAQCRAIEIGLGGGFLVLAALEVVFGW